MLICSHLAIPFIPIALFIRVNTHGVTFLEILCFAIGWFHSL